MNGNLKIFGIVICLLIFISADHIADAQQPLAQQAFAIFEQHCLDCHGEFGSYSDVLTIKHKDLIEDRAVIPGQPDASELYLRLLGDTDTGSQMPLGQEPLDSEAIATIRRWIEAGAPDWEAIPKLQRRFITTEAMLTAIHTHVTSLTAFDRSFARYFTLTHLYNAGASDDNLRAYRNALSKLVNSLSWGAEVIKPTPIDQEQTIFYIDLRHYEWDIKSDKWYKIEQAYPYGVQLKSSTYTTLYQETDCKLPFIRADWFIAAASLPPLYHEILDLPKTDKELEIRLEVDVSENIKNAPGVRVWRAGFNESGVSVNNRVVERHKSRYGAYWKSYDFAGNVGTQNIFTHPLNFTHDGGEIIFNLPNGLQAYYLSTAKGDRLDEAPINIVSNAGARDPVVRNGLSCMGCHTEGMKTFEDQVRPVIDQNRNPSYDKAQALRLYAEKPEMESLVREDIARYRRAIAAAGGVFGGSEPIQQLVKQFEGPLDATHAAAEVGLETDDFLKKIRENSTLQNAGLLVLGVEKGTVKRDAWESQFGTVASSVNLKPLTSKSEQIRRSELDIAANLESEEFKQLRTHATDAFNAKKYQQAIELYSQAIKMRPENSEVFNDLGAVYYIQGIQYAGPNWPSWEKELRDETPNEAVAELKIAIDKTASGAIVFKTRDEAVADAIEDEAKQLGGEVYRQRWENEITLNILIGETKEYLLRARDHYIRALDLKPTHSVASRNLGSFYMKVGKTDKALDYLQEAYKLNPRDAELEKYLNQFKKPSVLNETTASSSSSYANMVLIPAGEFQMGSSDGNREEKPVHTVYVDAFYIDKYEVTNAQYKAFVDANPEWRKDRTPRAYHTGYYLYEWNGNNYPSGKGNHPVTHVSWYVAMAYSKWAGKRLPTEAEWEKAARGGLAGQKYPWGNSIDPSKANYDKDIGNTTAVGRYAPNTYGLYDMTGNVWEWCLDAYHKDFYGRSPRRNPVSGSGDNISNIISNFADVKNFRVLRGGSWFNTKRLVRVAFRFYFTPMSSYDTIGFRCVRPVKP